MPIEQCLRFVPSAVDGLANVTEAAVYPDRLELKSAGHWVVFRFQEMGHWPIPAWLRRLHKCFRFRLQRTLTPVGERDYCRRDRYFRFWTRPPIVVHTPDELEGIYALTLFQRMHQVMRAGGFGTFDLA